MSYDLKFRPSTHWIERDGHAIKHIVIHGTESGTRQGEEGSLKYLVQNDARASAHDFVFANRVWSMVPVYRAANCVGYSILPGGERGDLANQVTYNIEGYKVKGEPMPMQVRETIAHRVADLVIQFGWSDDDLMERILFHREVDTRGKSCPGLDFKKEVFVTRVKAIIRDKTAETYRTDKLCWVFEYGADILRAEGYVREATMLLASDAYRQWKEERDS